MLFHFKVGVVVMEGMNATDLWRMRFTDLSTGLIGVLATIGTFWIVLVGKDIPPAIVAMDTTILGFLFGRGSVSVQTDKTD